MGFGCRQRDRSAAAAPDRALMSHRRYNQIVAAGTRPLPSENHQRGNLRKVY
ncbi:MAG: hypothetical protein AAF722_09345 [Cyanobacteria bacterium P01_C01_bin.70]